MTRVRIVFCATLLAGAVFGSPVEAQGNRAPVVDAAVQVTSTINPVRGHSGPAMAIHPDDDNVVALSEAEARSGQCGLHVTTDAGLSWNAATSPQPAEWPSCIWANYGRVTDVSFDKNGTLLYGLTALKSAGNLPSLVMGARSSDLGKTWALATPPGLEPKIQENNVGSHGEPTVRADPNKPNRVYMAWQTNWGVWNKNTNQLPTPGKAEERPFRSRPLLSVSEDGGKTFGQPVKFMGDAGEHINEPNIIVGDDGQVLIFSGESKGDEVPAPGKVVQGASIWMATSGDGGKTFQQKPIYTLPEDRVEGFSWMGAPQVAINRETGELYLVWEDIAGKTTSVQFMRSGDGGRTWSKPVQINDVAHPRHNYYNQLYPTVSVAPDGRVDVAWYDWRNDPTFTPDAKSGKFQDIYLRSSQDDGKNWSQGLKVNDRIINRQYGVFSTQDVNGPVALASTDKTAYVAWDDTRNGTPENAASDIYFTRVRFASPQEVVSGGQQDGPTWVWLLPGIAVGLALAGLLLLLSRGLVSGSRGTAGRAAAA